MELSGMACAFQLNSISAYTKNKMCIRDRTMAPMTTRGLTPMDRASGRMMGLTRAGMPQVLPVAKFSAATSRKVMAGSSTGPVSYTHLDVYKRQIQPYVFFSSDTVTLPQEEYTIRVRARWIMIVGDPDGQYMVADVGDWGPWASSGPEADLSLIHI